MRRTNTIRELVQQSMYPVDEWQVAEAILVRVAARQVVPAISFHSSERAPRPRSFRRSRDARSFRLTGVAAPLHHR